MNKKLAVFLLAVALACLWTASALAGTFETVLQKRELVVGTSGTYPPLSFKAKNGRIYGMDMDLAQAIASSMSVKLRVEVIPFDKLIDALEEGKIDMILAGMAITPPRNLRVAFVGPYLTTGQSILTTKDVAININGVGDLNRPEYSIAVARGTTTEKIARQIFPKADLVVTPSKNEALDYLLKRKVKALMADYGYTTVEAFRYRERGYVANPPFTVEYLGIAVRSGDTQMINYLQNFLGMLRGEGVLNAITAKWFNDAAWMEDLP